MKTTPPKLCVLFILLSCGLLLAFTSHAAMTVQSLSGPVTQTEITSFESFIQGQAPPTANTYDNNMADGTAGMNCEALGLMYEVTNDPALLNEMIQYADAFLSLRNDFTDKRVMWDGNVDPVWLTKAASSSQAGYAGCENNDIVGHIAYCARLILQSPSLWNATVPVGDPHGYGATYYQRAITYVTQMEVVQDNYMNVWFIDSTTDRIKDSTVVAPAFAALGQSTTAWNRQMMFLNGWQRLSECHAILGDNPSKVSFYDAIVQASVSWFQSEWQNTTGGGQPCYVWQYAPGHSGGNEEMNGHAAYDMWGLGRAFAAGKYGITQSLMRPFAETLRYIIYQGNNTFAEWVNGDTSKTRNYIYSQWMTVSAYDPCDFAIMANADIAQGSQGSTAIYDAFILWVKNSRNVGLYPNNCDTADFSLSSPWVETVTVGGTANYSVSVNSLAGFGSGVTISVAGLPAGLSASVSPGYNATITLSASSSTVPGVYPVTVTGSGGGITRTVPVTLVVAAVPDFSISATPGSQPVLVGGSTSYSVNIGSLDGFNGAVSLSVSGLPAGANASFSASPVTAPGSSTLNVTTTGSTPAGGYTLTITGTSGSLTHTASVNLSVSDFTVSATPGSQTVSAGASTNYTVTVGNINAFSGNVAFTASGLPAGATATFVPASVNSLGSSTLTIATASSTPAGTNTVTITGTSGSLSHSATVTLVVTTGAGDFSLSASPLSQTVIEGNGTNYTVTVTPAGGFNGVVNLSLSGLPAGASATFNPASITGSGSSTLTIGTTNTMSAGTNTLTITGTSGSLSHSATVTLVVNAASATWTTVNDTDTGITYSSGWSYGANRNFGDYQNDVHYTTGAGNYAQYTFTGTGVEYITETYSDEGNVDVYIDGVFQTTVNCNTATRQAQVVAYSNTALSSGSHTIKVVKNSGTYMLVDAFAFTSAAVPDFTMSATPSSQAVTPAGTATYMTTVGALNGFSGSVSLSVSGVPTGANASFSPTSISGSGSSTLSVSTSGSTPAGAYTLTLTGTSGSLIHSASVTLNVSDFTIAAAPSSQTLTAGSNTTYTATVSALNGFNGTVGFTLSGLPANTSGSFNPASINGSGSSTLTITTATNTPAGTNTLTITGTSGSLVHSATVTLIVNAPASGGLPTGWSDLDVGTPSIAGSASYSAGVFTINGSGADIWGTADQFHYVYQSTAGDQTLVARVVSQTGANAWAKSGIMVRETTSAGSSYVGLYVTPGNGVSMQYRNGTGTGAVDLGRLTGVTAPYWVKLVRSGNTFTGYSAPDGATWTQVGTISVSMASSVTAGLPTCSHDNTVLDTAKIDNVSITTPAPDFSISATPSSQTVTAGSNKTYTATVTPLNGFIASVGLTLSGLPANASGSFNPASIGGSGTSTLTVTTATNAPAGTNTLTITGTSGSLVHSATVTLVVTAAGATNSNIAPSGTAYGWSGMTSSTANTGKTAEPGLNDNNLTVNVDLQPNGDPVGAWEAGGVIWSSTKTIASVDFINGDITSGGDGFLTANLKLQFTTDGTTWTDSGWTVSPAYPYSSSAGGQTYTFNGTSTGGLLGVRVIGQVRTTDTSYHWILKEVQAIGH